MDRIVRYGLYCGVMTEQPHGYYVLYDDHKAAIDRLTGELAKKERILQEWRTAAYTYRGQKENLEAELAECREKLDAQLEEDIVSRQLLEKKIAELRERVRPIEIIVSDLIRCEDRLTWEISDITLAINKLDIQAIKAAQPKEDT
jgi:hypothetical protein